MGTERLGSASYRKPAYLLVLLDALGFLLLFMNKDYNLNVLYTGAAVLALFLII